MTLQLQRLDSRPGVYNERSSYVIRGRLTDAEGNGIAGSALTLATLRLYDLETDVTINGHEATDISDEIDESGDFEIRLHPDDGVIVSAGEPDTQEEHIALLMFEWEDAGEPEGLNHKVRLLVNRMAHVPAD